MSTRIFNPLTGKNAPGKRFRFRVRVLSHNNLYLPFEMKSITEIRRLLEGEFPLQVFGCNDLESARSCFRLLRMKYDFPYWAALKFRVADKEKPYEKVPLILNTHQQYLVDTFNRRRNAGLPGKYLVTKSTPQCGLTTCIQAYILWSQRYRYPHHSITVTTDLHCNDSLKYALAGNLGKKVTPDGVDVNAQVLASFLSIYEPYKVVGCRSGYVHMADMLKWHDPSAENTRRIFLDTSRGWDYNPNALFIFEGDTPVNYGFQPDKFRNYTVKESIRLGQIGIFFNNPYFVNWHLMLTDPHVSSDYHHINLDQTP